MKGFIFREYVNISYDTNLPKISFQEIITNPAQTMLELGSEFTQVQWEEYIQMGYYPFGNRLENADFSDIIL